MAAAYSPARWSVGRRRASVSALPPFRWMGVRSTCATITEPVMVPGPCGWALWARRSAVALASECYTQTLANAVVSSGARERLPSHAHLRATLFPGRDNGDEWRSAYGARVGMGTRQCYSVTCAWRLARRRIGRVSGTGAGAGAQRAGGPTAA
ncbi:hypothetical protein B0H14DRAFT_3006244 [Mycena olivaceomarginata]|nr:hypothetical protein B0H14DRAFT_3006244 [Mycena olivaceomarginata]